MRKARAETNRTPILLWSAALLVVTAAAYLPATQNLFTNWDDPGYILENPSIKRLDGDGVRHLFSSYHKGNYHPLTMLSFALDYRAWGLSPRGYHVVNVALHLLNTLGVLFFTRLLLSLRRERRAAQIALATALLFGVHPLHVESVAWIVGRKDLLYTLFFLGSLIAYCRFLASASVRFYALSLAAFVMALLSKGQAVTLPLVLVAIDLLVGVGTNSDVGVGSGSGSGSGSVSGSRSGSGSRTRSRMALEKLPFFALSLLFGVVAIAAQKQGEAVGDVSAYPLHQRIVFASYGLVQYVRKLLLPTDLSAFYPYFVRPGESLPLGYWLYPLLAIAGVLFVVWIARRRRWIAFGAAFFFVNLILVLQLLPVGAAIMADRYSYLSSIGLLLILAVLHGAWSARARNAVPTIALGVIAVLFAAITYARCQVWHDSGTLWSDVIAKHPEAPVAWNNRGIYRKDNGDFAGAMEDYSRALELDPGYALAYTNRAVARQRLGDFHGALEDLDRSISLDPGDSGAFVNRGVVQIRLGQTDRAIADFTRAIELDPSNAAAYGNRGTLRSNLGEYQAALADLDRSLALNPMQPDALVARALARSGAGDPESALADLDTALRLRPQHAAAYFFRGSIQIQQNRPQLACGDFSAALRLGYQPAQEQLRIHCGQ